jgi:hypothetical protein
MNEEDKTNLQPTQDAVPEAVSAPVGGGEDAELAQIRQELLSELSGGGASRPKISGGSFKAPSLKTNFKIGRGFFIFLAFIFLAGLSWYGWNQLVGGQATLSVKVTPPDANLKVAGRAVHLDTEGAGTIKVRSGSYEVVASKDNFRTQSVSIDIGRKETKNIVMTLRTVPELKTLADSAKFVAVSSDGKAAAYFDSASGKFIKYELAKSVASPLFEAKTFSGIDEVEWSPSLDQALVKFQGEQTFANMLDNRTTTGKYNNIGARPAQAPEFFDGRSNWLFDNTRYTSNGWQPIRLTDNIREAVFSPFGDKILYHYMAADGERSFIESLPDGREWVRLIPDVADLAVSQLEWANSSRYVLVYGAASPQAQPKILLLDRVAREIKDALTDTATAGVPHFTPDGKAIWFLNGDKILRYDLTAGKVLEPVILERPLTDMVFGTDNQAIGVDADGNLWQFADDGKLAPVNFLGESGQLVGAKLLFASTANYLLAIQASGKVLYLAL